MAALPQRRVGFGLQLQHAGLGQDLQGGVARQRGRPVQPGADGLVELAAAYAGEDAVEVAVHHLGAADRAEALASRLVAALPGASSCVVVEAGAVVGAHVGPGLLGVVVSLT